MSTLRDSRLLFSRWVSDCARFLRGEPEFEWVEHCDRDTDGGAKLSDSMVNAQTSSDTVGGVRARRLGCGDSTVKEGE